MNEPMSDISKWCWDGVSIESIKRHAAHYRLSLRDLVDDHFVGGWPDSVPEAYRGFICGRVERSAVTWAVDKGYRYFMQILACDQNQRALVLRGVSEIHTDAEGYDVVETSCAAALAWVDSYRTQAAAQV